MAKIEKDESKNKNEDKATKKVKKSSYSKKKSLKEVF